MQHSAAAKAMRDLQIQVEHDQKAEQVRTLQLSAYSFDVFVQDLFYTWGLAGSVISGTRELVLGTFVEFIWIYRPIHAHLTPSFGANIAVGEIRAKLFTQAKQWELVPRYGVGELALGGAQVGKDDLRNMAKTVKAFIWGGPCIDGRIYSAACASIKDEEAAVEHVETLYLLRPGADTDNNKVVVTFVPVKKDDVDTGKIRAQVFQRARDVLPAYMVPGHVVVMGTTMPRTVSNTDRKALKEIYKGSNLNVLAGRDSPKKSTGDGEQLGLQWTEEQLLVLQIIVDNFKVSKQAWSLRRQLKCMVGVFDLMRCQFLGELANVALMMPETPAKVSWLASTKDRITKKLRGDMQPHDTSYVLLATPVQESLIAETRLEPRAYWAHRVFDLSHLGEIDGHRLKEAWTAAAGNFDILRTSLVP
ncbi:hypothetical protein EDB80DRAFT_881175 [Ilyonectria destructans]|nr:hypothetical protein EDB80DRAFT_881175 [Ilyonectria destructans]